MPSHKAAIFAAAVLLSATTMAQTPALLEPDNAIAAGRDAIAGEEYIRASNILEQAYLASPRDVRLARWLGIAYYKAGLMERSVAQLERALELAPDDAETHYALGVVHLGQAQQAGIMQVRRALKASSEHLERALELDSEHVPAHYYLAQLLINAPRMMGGNEERARELNEALADLSPLHHQLIDARLALDNEAVDEAETLLLDAHRQSPDSTLTNYALLSFYHKQENFAAATDYGEAFLEGVDSWDDRSLAEVHLLLAEAYRELEQTELSLQHYAQTLRFTDNPGVVEEVQEAVAAMAAAADAS